MAIRIVRLGNPRLPDEGLRIGTVRRPPRGVPKSQYASQNWYDVRFPNLAPSAETLKLAQDAATEADWKAFVRRYRAEMSRPDNAHALDLLAGLSRTTNLSVGCYCVYESRCHRSVLRALLQEHGADLGLRYDSRSAFLGKSTHLRTLSGTLGEAQYLLDGKVGKVRMDEKPGNCLPVKNGKVLIGDAGAEVRKY